MEQNFIAEGTLLNILPIIKEVAKSNTKVLILGERGTGKELVAKAIHQSSSRHDKPFITINCAAIPENILESELFGHERGAFSGAARRVLGKFEQANDGTIFFDEIGDMSLLAQAKILRFLEENEFMRIGGSSCVKVNVKIILSTNKNLSLEIKRGLFRPELFDRINVLSLSIPPLRERKDEIPVLVKYFIEKFSCEQNKPKKTITTEGMSLLSEYSWPGNVRELKNLIEKLVVLTPSGIIRRDNILNDVYLDSNLDEDKKESLKENNIGELLKKARIAMGLSQTRVANALGPSYYHSTIANIESGKRKISADELEKLACLYKKSVTEFYS